MEQTRINELKPLRKAVEAVRKSDKERLIAEGLVRIYESGRRYYGETPTNKAKEEEASDRVAYWEEKYYKAFARFHKLWERIYGFGYNTGCERMIPKAELYYLNTGLC